MPQSIQGIFIINPDNERVQVQIAATNAETEEWGQGPWSNINPTWSTDPYATGITNPDKGECFMASIYAIVRGKRMEVARSDSHCETGWAWARRSWLPEQDGDEIFEHKSRW